MSGENLGKLLQEAGVKGGKPNSPPLTLEEARALSRKKMPEKTYSQEAMDRLPPAFAKLKNPEVIKKGKDFMKELCLIFRLADNNRIGDYVLSEHTLIGICQLVHWHRNHPTVSPSRKKSFDRVIPWLLECRDNVQNKPPTDIGQYMNERLDEHGSWISFH